jgi:phage gp36-like protein
MQYATAADMSARYGERELIELTDPDLTAVNLEKVALKLADAQAFADGFIARVYRLPLQGCAKPQVTPGVTEYACPPQLTRIVCDVARYYLYDDGLSPEHEVYLRFKAAEKELKAIAEGATVLTCPWGGAPGALVASDPLGEGEVYHSFSPRRITDDSCGGYA